MIRLFHLSAIPLVAALPIHNPPITSNGVTFLAILSAILSILTFLSVAKWLFTRSRQSWFTTLAALAPSSTPQFFSKFVHAQSGILVGFFASPAWETTVTLNVHKTLHERRRSFFAVEHQPCASHARSVSSFGQILELPSLICQPLKGSTPDTPSLPPALYDNARVSPRRRYSLPSVVRPRTQYGQIRRSYSTKARRAKRRKSYTHSITFAPMLPSKVVDDHIKHISPLSYYSLLDVGSYDGTNFFDPATKIPLTPPVPPYTVVKSGSTLCSLEDETSTVRQSFDLSVQESIFTNSLSPGDLQQDTPADSDNDPLSPITVFKLRPRQKTSTVRTRRSPPLGPSPLRTMILPESSEADISITTCHVKPSTMICNQAILNPLPEDEVATFDTLLSKQRVIGARPTNVQDGGPDPLLGMIRELVEEVHDWDDSLFMDQNFKFMIENSQEISSQKRRKLSPKSPPINSLSHDLDYINDPLQRQVTDVKECCMLSGGGQLVSFSEADPEDRDNIGIAH